MPEEAEKVTSAPAAKKATPAPVVAAPVVMPPPHIDMPALHQECKVLAKTLPKKEDGSISKRAMKAAIFGSPAMAAKFGFKNDRHQHFSEWFDSVDTDHNGSLAPEEIEDWLAHHASHPSMAEYIHALEGPASEWWAAASEYITVLVPHFSGAEVPSFCMPSCPDMADVIQHVIPDHIDLPDLLSSVKDLFATLSHEADAEGCISKRHIKAAISGSPAIAEKFGFSGRHKQLSRH